MRTVFVVGRKWRFRALLRAQLREEGYEARGFETLREASEELAGCSPPPAALVFDTADAPAEETQELAALAASRRAGALLVVAAGQKSFDFAQDKQVTVTGFQVLRRPLRLAEVVEAVKTLTAGRP